MDCTSRATYTYTYTYTYAYTYSSCTSYPSCACRCPRCGTELVYSGPKGVIEPNVPIEPAARLLSAGVTPPGATPACPGGGPARPGNGVVRPRSGPMPDR